jgi:hypothetical protein
MRSMLRTLIPAISAASTQLSFFAIAFKITSCSFIIRSVSRIGIPWLGSTLPDSPVRLDRTTHLLIPLDNSHANDTFIAAGFRKEYIDDGMRTVIVGVALWASSLYAVSPSETAVFSAFRQADAGLSHFVQLQRTGVTEELDLVIAIGSSKAFPAETRWIFWTEDRKIGLFLQEKTRLERVYLLGTKSGFPDCAARIERVTATDSVISCRGEKSEQFPNQKWIYDVRAKSLVRQFSYQPFAMCRLFSRTAGASKPNGAFFVGADRQRLIAVEYNPDEEPAFRVLSNAAAQPWTGRVHISAGIEGLPPRNVIYIENDKVPLPATVPALPRRTYDQFAAARPQRVKDGYVREGTELDESIGPWQREGGRIWFGKTFYDGEGSTGVGGFGYFDEKEKKLQLFDPPEIADWSVSALDVTPDALWMALVNNGEYGGSSGGLLRYDRHTSAARRLTLPDIALRLDHINGKILAATDFGFAVVEGDQIARFFVDQTTDGRWHVIPATR